MRSSDLAIRRLSPADAAAYRALRLRGLQEHPDAFTSSHAEESERPIAATERRIAPDSPDWVFGAFVGGALAGVVGLERKLYENLGFHSFGIEPRAIRVGDTYFDKNHMILFLALP